MAAARANLLAFVALCYGLTTTLLLVTERNPPHDSLLQLGHRPHGTDRLDTHGPGRSGRLAFATLLTVTPDGGDGHLLGVLALAHSLARHSALLRTGRADFVVLTGGMEPEHQALLQEAARAVVVPVPPTLVPSDCALQHSGTHHHKLSLWSLTQYARVVHLDTDCLVLDDIDDLFQLPLAVDEVAAAPDHNPPSMLNSGVLALVPNERTFADMGTALRERVCGTDGDSDGLWQLARQHGDQDFLLNFFGGRWRILPFNFNFQQTTLHGTRAPDTTPRRLFIQGHQDTDFLRIKVFHFTGAKPWVRVNGEWAGMHTLWWEELGGALAQLQEHDRRLIQHLKHRQQRPRLCQALGLEASKHDCAPRADH